MTRGHLARELASWGLDHDEADHVVGTTLTRLAEAYDQAARATPEVSRSIVTACQRRTEHLIRQAR